MCLCCSMCIEMGCKTDKGGITQNNQGHVQLPSYYIKKKVWKNHIMLCKKKAYIWFSVCCCFLLAMQWSLLWSVKSSLGGEDWKIISCAGYCISSIFINSRQNCGRAFLLLWLWGYIIAIIMPMLQASTCGQVWAFGPTPNRIQRKSDVHVEN